MRLSEIFNSEIEISEQEPPSKEYCQKTPRDKMSAFAVSNCVSRGYIEHKSDKKQDIDGDGEQEPIKGKKIPSVKHAGKSERHTPDWGGTTR